MEGFRPGEAVAAWVVGSIFGLIGPDPAEGGPLLFIARIGGVALVVLGLWSITRRVRRLIGPIYELVLATRRIEDGDYSVRVSEPVRGPRESRSALRATASRRSFGSAHGEPAGSARIASAPARAPRTDASTRPRPHRGSRKKRGRGGRWRGRVR